MANTIDGLYLVLSEAYGNGRSVVEIARQAIAGGVDILQMREKDKTPEEQRRLGRTLQALCRESGVIFIVNDDPHLARDLDADGVHLGQEDLRQYPIDAVRRMLGPGKIIGVSTHSPTQAVETCALGPDYIAYGPVFPTETKDYSIGTAGVRDVLESATCPVVLIGGIDPSNVDELLAQGARTIALIRDIMRSEHVAEQTKWYKDKLKVRSLKFEVHDESCTAAKAVHVRVNGREERLTARFTIAGLIALRGLAPPRVVVECNGEVVPRERWPETWVQDKDCLEIISFVGGG